MPRPRGGFRGRGPRRVPTWIGSADQLYINLASGASGIQQSFDPGASGLDKPTIVRVRGLFSVKLQTYAADLDVAGALGMCIVSNEAFTAGAASIPRPHDDSNWDGWFVWQAFSFRYEFNDATGSQFPASWDVQVDSKAMRKVTENETVVVMVENLAGAMASAFSFCMLVLLA